MTAKQKYQADRAALARAVERVGRTTSDEWQRMVDMYETEDPNVPMTEPIEVTQNRILSPERHPSEQMPI